MSQPPAEFDEVRRSWSPTGEQVTGRLDPWPAQALAALLGTTLPGDGTLPPLWSEAYLRSARPVSALGEDGHPADGALVPPLPHRRRMFGGGRIVVTAPLRLGETATRTSSVRDVRLRQGRSGWLLLLTELHELRVGDDVRVREERDIVYRRPEDVARPAASGGTPASCGAGVPDDDADFVLHPDERQLFCFSALTYNAHRIHYDRDYTRQVEGHRDLLVHGPLLVIGAIEAARRIRPEASAPITSVDYRLVAPSHPGSPVVFSTAPGNDRTARVVGTQDGVATVEARVG
ncbi:MAG TPA: hypothetical protein VFM50_04175 [Nocardioidaceae bacterium]|nr:hypothetical protein [Nocardioidaceae bacterium]